MIINQLKYFLLFLLTFLLGVQTAYAKTELVLPQNQSSFPFKHSQKANSLKKALQPNIGFLIEKTKFEVSEGFSAWNLHKYLDRDAHLLGNAGSGLFNYSKVRSFLGDGRVLAHLNSQELNAFENLLKTADPDVLKIMDEFDGVDEFAEMVRGYKDNPTAFTNAIKNTGAFNGNQGWLKFWKLTPKIQNSLDEIALLKSSSKIDNFGNATDIQLASIHTYTVNGNFINVPYRYTPSWFGVYNTRAVKHINEGLDELRKIPSRVIKNEEVFSGKTFSKTDFESKFVGKNNTTHTYNGYMSTSKLESVAEGFVELTTQWAGNREKIAVIQRVTSKNGVYIDDISDWGKNLGPKNHPNVNSKVIIQEEVLLNSETLKQISEPIPIMENGVHKTIDGMKVYYVDFVEIL